MITKIALGLAIVLGTASFSAYAQSARPSSWTAVQMQDSGTANSGNETTAAGGAGRVNSHQQS